MGVYGFLGVDWGGCEEGGEGCAGGEEGGLERGVLVWFGAGGLRRTRAVWNWRKAIVVGDWDG